MITELYIVLSEIYSADQCTGFYVIGTFMKELMFL